MAAIDRYYAERNAFFKANPKRAGKKIWGKEASRVSFPPRTTAKIQSTFFSASSLGTRLFAG